MAGFCMLSSLSNFIKRDTLFMYEMYKTFCESISKIYLISYVKFYRDKIDIV